MFRPVTESVTVPAADTEQILVMNVSTVTTEQSELSDTDVPSAEHSEFIDRSVTELVTARDGSNTDFPNGEHSEFVDRPVTESVTALAADDTEQILVMNVSTVTTEQSELRGMVLGKTNKRDIPLYSIECAPERRQPESISPGALRRVEMSNNQWTNRV